MGESVVVKLLLMATTASFCALFPHLFILNSTGKKISFVFAGLNEICHLIHYILTIKLKKRHFIMGMVFYGSCASCGLVVIIFNIVFVADNQATGYEKAAVAIWLCLIQSSIVLVFDLVCILIEILKRREQRIRDGLESKSSSQKSQKKSPEKFEQRTDLQEKTPKTKTPMIDIKSDRKKKEDDSPKDLKKSDREMEKKDHSEKDRRERDKSRSEKKDRERDKTKSGRSEKKDGKSGKSTKDNSEKSKDKSHSRRSSKKDDDRRKSDKDRRKKSSKKS
uniref:Uncharacterized protein n=1 Tax=Pristionchus pacificus TaxID=54126 RepID=A0A2A6BZ10_PRIPA|eukprot:PDM71242.1 hypothetical protein PRIPAC_43625 [Pristionchus pacificus]